MWEVNVSSNTRQTNGKFFVSVVAAVKSLSSVVVGKTLRYIFDDFARTWRALTSESQMRWVSDASHCLSIPVIGETASRVSRLAPTHPLSLISGRASKTLVFYALVAGFQGVFSCGRWSRRRA